MLTDGPSTYALQNHLQHHKLPRHFPEHAPVWTRQGNTQETLRHHNNILFFLLGDYMYPLVLSICMRAALAACSPKQPHA
jgi:hypothetical protein